MAINYVKQAWIFDEESIIKEYDSFPPEKRITKLKYIYTGCPRYLLSKKKADSLANLKTIFPQRKCRGTNSFRVIND